MPGRNYRRVDLGCRVRIARYRVERGPGFPRAVSPDRSAQTAQRYYSRVFLDEESLARHTEKYRRVEERTNVGFAGSLVSGASGNSTKAAPFLSRIAVEVAAEVAADVQRGRKSRSRVSPPTRTRYVRAFFSDGFVLNINEDTRKRCVLLAWPKRYACMCVYVTVKAYMYMRVHHVLF